MQDLSGLAAGWSGTGSMHAGNTVSEPNTTGAAPLPGSTSEATATVPTGDPSLDIPGASQSYRTQLAAAPADHPAHTWTDVNDQVHDAPWTEC